MVEITEKDVVSFEKDGVIKIKDFIPVNQLEELDRAITPYLARRKLLNKLIFGDSLSIRFPPWVSISFKVLVPIGPSNVMSLNHNFNSRKTSNKWRPDPRYAMTTDMLLLIEGDIIQYQ